MLPLIADKSFVTVNQSVVYLSQLHHLQEIYKNVISGCQNKCNLLYFAPKSCYFVVEKAYIQVKKQHDAANNEQDTGSSGSKSDVKLKRRKRKYKRKLSFNQGELDLIDYHNEIKDRLIDGVLAINQHFSKIMPMQLCHLQAIADSAGTSNSLENHSNCPFSVDFQELFGCFKLDDNFNFKLNQLPSVVVNNNCWFSHMLNVTGNVYLIPKQCKFLCSDITMLNPLVLECQKYGKYSCIVLDPLWENKSVKRSKKYSTLSFDEIASLPINEFCVDGCMMIVWVTNKQKLLKWVKEDLFKKWNVTYITEWHWVKVTTSIEPVFPWESLHKKPYETLVLGYYNNFANETDFSSLQDLVICSMPSAVHSHKPSLSNVIENCVKQYYQEPFRCLELFARNLTPGWTSWGNEVLMMQNITYFDKLE